MFFFFYAFCRDSVHFPPPYRLVFNIITCYLSELLKAIELGQLRARPCALERWWKRNVLPPSVCLTIDDSDFSPQTRSDTVLLPSLEPPGSPLTTTETLLLPWCSTLIGRLESDLKALQGSREALEGQSVTAELDVTCGANDAGGPGETPCWAPACVSTCVSVSVTCAPRTWKHTRE